MKHWTYLMAEGITTREKGRGQVKGVDRVAAGSPRTVQPLAGAIPYQLRVRRRGRTADHFSASRTSVSSMEWG